MSKPAPLSLSVSTLLRLPADGRLSALEWSVVALAARDDVASLKGPGRIARAFASLFPSSRRQSEGDPRLEALRRITILTHRMGAAVPLTEIRRFLEAGFSIAQYAIVAASLGRGALP